MQISQDQRVVSFPKQEPSCCHWSQLFQATRTLLPLVLVVEKDQLQQGEDIAKAFLLEISECQKRFSEQHP